MEKMHPNKTILLNHLMGFKIEESLQNHISTCDSCKLVLAELKADKERTETYLQPEIKIEQIFNEHKSNKRKRKFGFNNLIPSFSAAAIVMLICFSYFFIIEPNNKNIEPRIKGAFTVEVFVKKDKSVMLTNSKTQFGKNDQIRVGILSPENGYISVFSMNNDVKVPIKQLLNLKVFAGRHFVLPGSLYLDCDKEVELLHIYLTESPTVNGIVKDIIQLKRLKLRCE